MKNINYKKAKDFKPGETVRDLGSSFIVKEARVIGEPGLISFLDTEDVWHGTITQMNTSEQAKNSASMPRLTIGK